MGDGNNHRDAVSIKAPVWFRVRYGASRLGSLRFIKTNNYREPPPHPYRQHLPRARVAPENDSCFGAGRNRTTAKPSFATSNKDHIEQTWDTQKASVMDITASFVLSQTLVGHPPHEPASLVDGVKSNTVFKAIYPSACPVFGVGRRSQPGPAAV